MTHSKRTLMILAGIGLLIVGAVLVTVKTNIGWGQAGQDASSDNAGAHGPKISERDDRNALSDFENKLRQLIDSDMEQSEKTKRLVVLLDDLHQAKEWIFSAEDAVVADLIGDDLENITRMLENEGVIRECLRLSILDWFNESPNEAVDYADSIENEEIQAFALGAIILELCVENADDAFEMALELAKLQPANNEESSRSNSVLYSIAASRSPEDFRRVYESLGYALDYPYIYAAFDTMRDYGKDYAYGEMLQTIEDIKSSIPEDRHFPVDTNGLFAKWAAYEPRSAYEWLLQNGDRSQFIYYVKGYASRDTASPQEIGRLVAEWDVHHETPESRARAFQIAITRSDSAKVMNAYFEALAIRGNRDVYLSEFLMGHQTADSFAPFYPDGPHDPFSPDYGEPYTIILNAMNSNARMTYILNSGRIDDWNGEQTMAIFKGLGHSDEDIKRLENHFSKAE